MIVFGFDPFCVVVPWLSFSISRRTGSGDPAPPSAEETGAAEHQGSSARGTGGATPLRRVRGEH